jgi:hypothetical protein
MNAQVDARDLTPMFERLLEALETALDLASRADRDDRLTEIADHLGLAVQLATDAIADRG